MNSWWEQVTTSLHLKRSKWGIVSRWNQETKTEIAEREGHSHVFRVSWRGENHVPLLRDAGVGRAEVTAGQSKESLGRWVCDVLGQPQTTSAVDERDYRIKGTYFKRSWQLVRAIILQFRISSFLSQLNLFPAGPTHLMSAL